MMSVKLDALIPAVISVHLYDQWLMYSIAACKYLYTQRHRHRHRHTGEIRVGEQNHTPFYKLS